MNKKGSFKENPDNFFDTEMRLKAIEGGVASHQAKISDDNRLGIPAYDESVTSDYIRNRVEPPADMVSGRKVFKVEVVEQPEGEYDKDLKKLQALTRGQLDELLKEVKRKSSEGKGLFSLGPLLRSYAIDRQTLESFQSIHHEDDAASELAFNIAQKLWNSGNFEANVDMIKRRIMIGTVYLEVPGFKTPIVGLVLGLKEMGNRVPKEDVEKIARHLKQERKLLPISMDLRVL